MTFIELMELVPQEEKGAVLADLYDRPHIEHEKTDSIKIEIPLMDALRAELKKASKW